MSTKQIFECENCGKNFITYYIAKQKFCCRACQLQFTQKKYQRTCQQCGKEFVAHSSTAGLYCSHSCYAESLKGKTPHNYDPVEKICQVCGTRFEVERGRETTAKYCSFACSGKSHATNDNRLCIHCGREFKIWSPRKGTARFCSRKCRGKHYSGQNSPWWKTGNRRYYYGPNWKEQREACRERDKHTCRHCGRKHRKGERLFDVHHIRPFITFGYKRGENESYLEANELTNLITLCLPCHMKAERGTISYQLNLL